MSTNNEARREPGEHGRVEPVLLDVKAVAQMLSCSPRHVYRLADEGKFLRPFRLGTLVRWPKKAVLEWLADVSEQVR